MVSDRVERILAPNPSPMTLEGTNTYLIDAGSCAVVVDPGPPIDAHVLAIRSAAARRGRQIAAILVTHGHPDHAPAAALLAAATGAPVYAHALARFPHDVRAAGGDVLAFGDARIAVVDAPGHARDHLVFALDGGATLFTGDVVIGRGTIVIAPPEGDMRAYQETLGRLRREFGAADRLLGGHGPAVDDPAGRFDEYLAHRVAREAELLAALGDGLSTLPELVARIYAATPTVLWPAAARQLLAYLIALEREGRVRERDAGRPPDADELELLNPDLGRIADRTTAELVRAELGADARLERLVAYELVA